MNTRLALILLMMVLSFSSCELIGDIFKAGAWTGALLVIAVIALIFFILFKMFGKKG